VALVAFVFARRWAAGALSRALAAPVEVGGVWIDPRANVTLTGVRIGDDPSGPAIARVDVDPDFRRLVRGEPIVNRVAVSGLAATLEQARDGTVAIRGFALPATGGTGSGLDVRELVVRDSDLVGIPPPGTRADPVSLHVERLVARQVPTAASGVRSFAATLKGTLDGAQLAAEAIAELADDGGKKLTATADVGGTTFGEGRLPLPNGLRSFAATIEGRVGYALDTAEQRHVVTADLRASDVAVATDWGLDLKAARLAADDVAIDLAHDWAWRAGRVEIANAKGFVERAGRRQEVAIERAAVRDLARARPGALAASGRIAGGTFEANGSFGVEPERADVTIDVAGASLPELGRLAPDLPLAIARGTASAHLRARYDDGRERVSGTVEAQQVHTAPPTEARRDEVLAVDRLEAHFELDSAREAGAAGTERGPALRVSRLVLRDPYAMILRRTEGTFPLSAFAAPRAAAPAPGAAGERAPAGERTPVPEDSPARTPEAAEPVASRTAGSQASEPDAFPPPLSVAIAEVAIESGRADFVDQTVSPAYWAGVSSLAGTASGVRWPALAVERIALRGLHDEISPLDLGGRSVGTGVAGTISADRLSAATLNPYLAPVLGYRAEAGTVTLRVDGTLHPDAFRADTSVTLSGLSLLQTGLDVIGRETGVPLPVALSLLKGIGGDVELTVPIEGDPRSGTFRLGSVVAQAIGRAVLSAIASPLRLLGLLFGTDGPPHALAIDPVAFPTGSGSLDAAGEQRVAQIARILAAHPELVLVEKAQLSAADRAGKSPEELARLADERVAGVRGPLLGRPAGGAGAAVARVFRRTVDALRGAEKPEPLAPAPVAESRVIVAPWRADENPGGDPISGVYVELQAP